MGILGSSGLGRVGTSDMHLQEVPDDVPGGSVGRGGVVTAWGTAWDWGGWRHGAQMFVSNLILVLEITSH